MTQAQRKPSIASANTKLFPAGRLNVPLGRPQNFSRVELLLYLNRTAGGEFKCLDATSLFVDKYR